MAKLEAATSADPPSAASPEQAAAMTDIQGDATKDAPGASEAELDPTEAIPKGPPKPAPSLAPEAANALTPAPVPGADASAAAHAHGISSAAVAVAALGNADRHAGDWSVVLAAELGRLLGPAGAAALAQGLLSSSSIEAEAPNGGLRPVPQRLRAARGADARGGEGGQEGATLSPPADRAAAAVAPRPEDEDMASVAVRQSLDAKIVEEDATDLAEAKTAEAETADKDIAEPKAAADGSGAPSSTAGGVSAPLPLPLLPTPAPLAAALVSSPATATAAVPGPGAVVSTSFVVAPVAVQVPTSSSSSERDVARRSFVEKAARVASHQSRAWMPPPPRRPSLALHSSLWPQEQAQAQAQEQSFDDPISFDDAIGVAFEQLVSEGVDGLSEDEVVARVSERAAELMPLLATELRKEMARARWQALKMPPAPPTEPLHISDPGAGVGAWAAQSSALVCSLPPMAVPQPPSSAPVPAKGGTWLDAAYLGQLGLSSEDIAEIAQGTERGAQLMEIIHVAEQAALDDMRTIGM